MYTMLIPLEQLIPMLIVGALLIVLVVVLIVTRRSPVPPSLEEYVVRQRAGVAEGGTAKGSDVESLAVELRRRLEEIEDAVNEIRRMLEYRYPAFIQSGIVPGSLADVAQLFNLQYLRVEVGGTVEEVGSLRIGEESVDEVRRLSNKFAIIGRDDIVVHYIRDGRVEVYAVTVGRVLDLKDLIMLKELIKQYYSI